MSCPDCGCFVGEFQFAHSVETHGLDCGPYESFNEEFVVCRGCDGRFEPTDWSAVTDASTEMDFQRRHKSAR